MNTPVSSLQRELEEYLEGTDASIGVAVIINRKDTIEVNGAVMPINF